LQIAWFNFGAGVQNRSQRSRSAKLFAPSESAPTITPIPSICNHIHEK